MNPEIILTAFLKALPNGKNTVPIELVVNKMGSSLELNLKIRLLLGQDGKQVVCVQKDDLLKEDVAIDLKK